MASVRPFPRDYEVCETCGYDHAYDLPTLSPTARAEAERLHSLPPPAASQPFLSAFLGGIATYSRGRDGR